MFGRGRFCLLAIVVLMPIVLVAQTERSPAAAQTARSIIHKLPEAVGPGWEPVHLPPRIPVGPPGTGLPQLTRAAGMIFSGIVTKVERRPAIDGQALETVAITFHVENSIRGSIPGEDLVITQWIGLWSAGQRYRVGERVLVFFYPPSKLGLTSCVGGAMGRFAIDSSGRVLLTAQHLAAFQRDPVLGGKSHVRISDFALAVRQADEEE